VGSLKTLAEVLPGSRVDSPRDTAALSVTDIRLRFGGLEALRGVSFDVMPRELFAIIGPNGSGKTSIFNCLSGVYRPQEGSISFLGDDLRRRSPVEIAHAGVARMFQNIALFENLTVLDNLMLGRHPHVRYGTLAAFLWIGRARREEVRHREVVEEIVEFLEIEPYRKAHVGLLPQGIKKRVELGRALAMEPKLLLLDEPVAGMNVEETEDMARFVVDIGRELSIPMVLVEHDMGLVMDLADRVLVLDFGAPVAVGTPDAVQRDPNVIKAYLGEEHSASQRAAGDVMAAEAGAGGAP
jgi:branched-chain amino acid transport system ATP-binding protein